MCTPGHTQAYASIGALWTMGGRGSAVAWPARWQQPVLTFTEVKGCLEITQNGHSVDVDYSTVWFMVYNWWSVAGNGTKTGDIVCGENLYMSSVQANLHAENADIVTAMLTKPPPAPSTSSSQSRTIPLTSAAAAGTKGP